MKNEIFIIGAGLSGSEAAWQLAKFGIPVCLKEMRPLKSTPAHQTGNMAELVCSNSFRSDDSAMNAVGVLHEELRTCDSLLLRCADESKVPAGGALAVDRVKFSSLVEERISSHPLIRVERGEVTDIPSGTGIIATGPLTSEALTSKNASLISSDSLHFFDAIAPVVFSESVNMDIAWRQSRWDKNQNPDDMGGDYINCPLNKEEYYNFVNELLSADKVEFAPWEKDTPYFDGCLPVEEMAKRGVDTLAFGPMKPVGLSNPHKENAREFAVVQLRQDNLSGSLLNMVGFQTKMRIGEQKRVFRMIPALENAEFARMGSVHRNTFINSPKELSSTLALHTLPRVRFAGQITGCEGYVESIATGLLAGIFTAFSVQKKDILLPPVTTALGSILNHVTGKKKGDGVNNFQPSNINFGLFPELDFIPSLKRQPRGKDKKKMQAERALKDVCQWWDSIKQEFPKERF